MKFTKYSSLTNHYESRMIDAVILNGLTKSDVLWSAREKIHGANFSFITDGVTVTPAKRTGEILPAESFYGCADVVATHINKIKSLFRAVAKEGDIVQVFGELAGDGVQKGVDYGNKDFYGFDILVNGLYLPEDQVSYFLRYAEIRTAPLLGVGTFDQLKKLPATFDSVVKKSRELPHTPPDGPENMFDIVEAIEDSVNIAEGYVLKPVEPAFVHVGRVAIKCKTTKFLEKKNKNADGYKAPSNLSEKDQEQYKEFEVYLTENRVRNVLSKESVDKLTAKDFGRIMGLTVQDALEEIEREHGKPFIQFFENPALAKKLFSQDAVVIVRNRWGDILSGNF